MKLKLHNFKNHSDMELEFPEEGLVRISGSSGIGKSNILKAIDWGLFGKVSSPVTYGKTRGYVEIEGLLNQTVFRRKGPNLLTYGGEEVTNEAAQEAIQGALGLSREEWDLSSFIKQGQSNGIINKAPSSQTALISSLAIKDQEKHELVRKKIKSKIKDTSYELQALENKRENLIEPIKLLKEQIRDLERDIKELKPQVVRTEEEITKQAYDEAVAIIDDYNHSESCKRQLKTAEQPLSEQELKDLEESIEAGKKELKELEDKGKELSNKVELVRRSLSGQRNTEEIKRHANFLRGTFREELNEENFMFEVKNIELYKNGSKHLKSLAELLEVYTGTEKQKEEVINKGKEIERQYSLCKSDYKAVKLRIGLANAQKTKNQEKIANIAVLKKNIKDLDYSKVEEAKELISAKQQQEELKNVKKKYNEKVSQLTRKKKDLKTKQEDDKTIAANIKETIAKHSNLIELLDIYEKNTLKAIENIVSSINRKAAYWIDLMLGDVFTCGITTIKELKSGEQKLKMNLEIIENGESITKLSDLSGGQQSRLVLAFQLALNELYKAPILLLDEPFSGLDTESMKPCLEALKEMSEEKLILMVEHHAPEEYFDATYEV